MLLSLTRSRATIYTFLLVTSAWLALSPAILIVSSLIWLLVAVAGIALLTKFDTTSHKSVVLPDLPTHYSWNCCSMSGQWAC